MLSLTRFKIDNYYAGDFRQSTRPDPYDTPMQIYDVSVALSHITPTYPGDPKIEIKDWSSLSAGDSANVTDLHLGAHSGTHIDAPAHFIAGGPTVPSLPLSTLIGRAEVIEVPGDIHVIEESFVSNNCKRGPERVLFKTRNSDFWNFPEEGFRVDYTYIDAPAAKCLVDLGIKLVGIDYLSVERYESKTFATHHVFLSNGVVVLEGLDLRSVSAGSFELICLPLKIAGGSGDGAPARAILRTLT